MPVAKGMGRRKQNASISAVLDRRLMSYALAAGATLAASTPSKAEVLFTPNNSFLKTPSSLFIDLNHDGVADFRLRLREVLVTSSSFDYGFVGAVNAYGNGPSNQFAESTFGILLALKRSERIGNQFRFGSQAFMATGRGRLGVFDNLQNRFLGVKLVVNGEVHFGWIGFRRVDVRKTVQVTLAGWAYETVPGKAIAAGDTGNGEELSVQPTSLENLGAGHTGIDERRKRATNVG